MSSSCELRVLADVFGLAKATVHEYVKEVTHLILEVLMPIWIKMPNSEEAPHLCAISKDKSGTEQLLLAIDGSHITVTAPRVGYADYINRKGWPSLVLQGVFDPTLL